MIVILKYILLKQLKNKISNNKYDFCKFKKLKIKCMIFFKNNFKMNKTYKNYFTIFLLIYLMFAHIKHLFIYYYGLLIQEYLYLFYYI